MRKKESGAGECPLMGFSLFFSPLRGAFALMEEEELINERNAERFRDRGNLFLPLPPPLFLIASHG